MYYFIREMTHSFESSENPDIAKLFPTFTCTKIQSSHDNGFGFVENKVSSGKSDF